MAKVLVTGATGFIGGHLLPVLQSEGFAVRALEQGMDVADERSWRALESADAVVHLAAVSSMAQADADPLRAYEVNVLGTMHALRFCSRTGARLILASTAAVYGPPQSLPLYEDHALQPQNAYSRSKAMAEAIAGDSRVHVTILRFANVYGPRQSPDFLIPTILSQLRGGKGVALGNPSSKREYLYIDDAVAAIVAALRAQEDGVFNIGTGQSTSVEEMVGLLQGIYGPFPVTYDRSRPGGVPDIYFDCSRAQERLRWRAKVPLTDGLRLTLKGEGLQ